MLIQNGISYGRILSRSFRARFDNLNGVDGTDGGTRYLVESKPISFLIYKTLQSVSLMVGSKSKRAIVE